MKLAEGFYSKKQMYQNLSDILEEAIEKVEKSQREAESLLMKMDAEERVENLEDDELQPLSKVMERVS